MAIKKRTITLTGDNVTGAGFVTAVTGVGHASGALGLGAAYAALRQVRVYGDADTLDLQFVDADGVIIAQFIGIDASGTAAAEDTFGHAGGVTGAGVVGIGNPRYRADGAVQVASASTVTGAAPEGHYPIARSPLTVKASYVAAATITVDLFVEV